jgi:hypothetical protein
VGVFKTGGGGGGFSPKAGVFWPGVEGLTEALVVFVSFEWTL